MVGPGRILPPLASPSGPAYDDVTVARAFACGVYSGHSPRFHVEGPALMVDRIDAAALRIGPSSVLVRNDLGDGQLTAKPLVEQALSETGMARLDCDTPLAAPAAIQTLGLRMSSWDLWGTDPDVAFAALRTTAVGDEWNPVLAGGPAEAGVAYP